MERIERAYEVYNLLSKHLKEELSDEEKTQLNDWVNHSGVNRSLFLEISNPDSLKKAVLDYYKIVEEPETEESGEGEMGSVVNVYVKSSSRARYYVAAAAVLLMLAGAWLWFRIYNKNQNKSENAAKYGLMADIDPGKDGAVLTLADGRQIVLDTVQNGLLALQGRSEIRKKDGQISYDISETSRNRMPSSVQYNTLSTPRGRQFQLMLPDGSRLWLNAASFVKFPTVFNGPDRRIEVSGEAYLEVAKDTSKPFILLTDSVSMEVLGTKFNVNSYRDDGSIKTTLIEGKVKLISGKSEAILAPGQQGRVTDYTVNVISNINVNEAIAWRNGLIAFTRADIKQAMNQISRWYNVEIEYETPVAVPVITGKIPRSLKLSEALELLELYTGLSFIIKGTTITVQQPR